MEGFVNPYLVDFPSFVDQQREALRVSIAGHDYELPVVAIHPGRTWAAAQRIVLKEPTSTGIEILKQGMILSNRAGESRDAPAGLFVVHVYPDVHSAHRGLMHALRRMRGQDRPLLEMSRDETEDLWHASWTLHRAHPNVVRNYESEAEWTASAFRRAYLDVKREVHDLLLASASIEDILGRRNNTRLALKLRAAHSRLVALLIRLDGIIDAYTCRSVVVGGYIDEIMLLLAQIDRVAHQASTSGPTMGFGTDPKRRVIVSKRLARFADDIDTLLIPRPFGNLVSNCVGDFRKASAALTAGRKEEAARVLHRTHRAVRGFRRFRTDLEGCRLVLGEFSSSDSLNQLAVLGLGRSVAGVRMEMGQKIRDGDYRGQYYDYDFGGARYVEQVIGRLRGIENMIQDPNTQVRAIKASLATACRPF